MIFKRPWILFLLVIGVALFALVQFVRFGEAVALWDFLQSLPSAVSPLYPAITGLGWGIFGLLAAVWLWGGLPRGKAAVRILAVTYAFYYWLDQAFIGTSELRSTNWPFLAAATAVLLVLVFGSLALPAVNHFFGDEHDQKEQDR